MYPDDEFRADGNSYTPTEPPISDPLPDDFFDAPAEQTPSDGNAIPLGDAAGGAYESAGPADTSGYGSGAPYYGGGNGAYVPPTPPTPPSAPQAPKGGKAKAARRGMRPWLVIVLCVVCALIGGCAAGGIFFFTYSQTQSEEALPVSTTTVQSGLPVTTTVETVQVEAGDKMSVAQIYAAYSDSVACIEVSTESGTGAGTGFVITEDGYMVTCYHVIDGAEDIVVTFPSDNSSYTATLVGGDEDEDIAVLKIDAEGLTPVVLGDSDSLQVGDTVTSIGNALGTLSNTTTTGVISALDRAISMSDGSVMILLQTDCTLNSGNSGGPLFNEYGQVIGIVNAKYSTSASTYSSASIEGIGFAIPYSNVAKKVNDLMEYGYITGKPSLGISVSTVTPLVAEQYNMVVGAFVNSVEEGSCAETGGLQANDIITNVDGIEITSYEELVTAKNTHTAGDEMVMEVWRNGETLTVTVVLDEEQPEEESETETAQEEPESESSGSDEQNDQDYGNMSPEDFFDYFFGGGSDGWSFGSGGQSRGWGGW